MQFDGGGSVDLDIRQDGDSRWRIQNRNPIDSRDTDRGVRLCRQEDGVRSATVEVMGSTASQVVTIAWPEGLHRVRVGGWEGSPVCIQEVCLIYPDEKQALEPISVPVEGRNPLEDAQEITLARTLVGLNGWTVEMPDTVSLGAGESTMVNVALTPPAKGTLEGAFAGDRSYLDVWTFGAEDNLLGGVRVEVSR